MAASSDASKYLPSQARALKVTWETRRMPGITVVTESKLRQYLSAAAASVSALGPMTTRASWSARRQVYARRSPPK